MIELLISQISQNAKNIDNVRNFVNRNIFKNSMFIFLLSIGYITMYNKLKENNEKIEELKKEISKGE